MASSSLRYRKDIRRREGITFQGSSQVIQRSLMNSERCTGTKENQKADAGFSDRSCPKVFEENLNEKLKILLEASGVITTVTIPGDENNSG